MPSLRYVVRNMRELAAVPSTDPDAADLEPFYSPRHYAWLGLPERKRQWSVGALELARAVLANEFTHERSMRVSPSSLGTDCEREILFSYGGAPQQPRPAKIEDVMGSGSFEHLRWQMEGLSAGYLVDAEVWMHSAALRCGGSLDGIGSDSSLFEFKNTASHLYEAISKGPEHLARALKREAEGTGSAAAYAAHMVRKHKMQMETYWLLDSMQETPRLSTKGSLVYQDRASKDVFEIRVQTHPGRRIEVHRILEGLHDWIDLNQLPDMLVGCEKAMGYGDSAPSAKERTVYGRCAYREHCPTAQTVTMSSRKTVAKK